MKKDKYGLIIDGVLMQAQYEPQEGFVKIPDDAVCGQMKKGKKFIDAPKREKEYWELRQENYPDLGDQLDALWKELNYRQIKGDAIKTDEARDMLGKILQVKEDYPKPKKKNRK